MSALYDDIGGADGVRTAVSVMYNRITADPELAPWFDGIPMDRLRAHQRAFLAAAFGGPAIFTGRSAQAAHEGMAITDDAFDRVVSSLLTALADLGVAHATVHEVGRRLEELRRDVVTA